MQVSNFTRIPTTTQEEKQMSRKFPYHPHRKKPLASQPRGQKTTRLGFARQGFASKNETGIQPGPLEDTTRSYCNSFSFTKATRRRRRRHTLLIIIIIVMLTTKPQWKPPPRCRSISANTQSGCHPTEERKSFLVPTTRRCSFSLPRRETQRTSSARSPRGVRA